MKTATKIENAISVIANYEMDGHFWLQVPCNGYEGWDSLPVAVSFEGKDYARSGWNSDKNLAYYTTNKKYAIRK